ncbi:hypothetical protein L218DRAFT_417650 [Marasmius fiardii PR-910]|nr:hypothetical protein L218DRAFT_417650 [Marasmius fiardii PR-910]
MGGEGDSAEESVVEGRRQKGNSKRKNAIRWYIEESSLAPGIPIVYDAEVSAKTNEDHTSELRPHQWCSSRTELLLIHPELSRKSCVNGIAWAGMPFPIILLERRNGFSISSFNPEESESSNHKETTMDMTINRTFECAIKDLPGGPLSRIPLPSPATALPPNKSIISNKVAQPDAGNVESAGTLETLQASSENRTKERWEAAAEISIKCETSDVPLSVIERKGLSFTDPTRRKRGKKGQKPSRRSNRLKGSSSDGSNSVDPGQLLTDADRDRNPNRAVEGSSNSERVEFKKEPNFVHEWSPPSSDVLEQKHISPARSETHVSPAPDLRDAHHANTQRRKTRPELTLNTQCTSVDVSASSLAPLTPLVSLFSDTEHSVSAPLRRSARISSIKPEPAEAVSASQSMKRSRSKPDQIPVNEVGHLSETLGRRERISCTDHDTVYSPPNRKRKGGVTDESGKPKKQRREKDDVEATNTRQVKSGEKEFSSSLQSHPMKIRRYTAKEDPFLKALPNRLRKQLQNAGDLDDTYESKGTRETPLPFPSQKYTRMKIKKNKTPGTTPVSATDTSSPLSFTAKESSTRSPTSPIPGTTLVAPSVPETLVSNAKAVVDHLPQNIPPTEVSFISSETPGSLMQTIPSTNPNSFVTHTEDMVLPEPGSVKLNHGLTSDIVSSDHLPETKHSQGDARSTSPLPAIPSVKTTESMDHSLLVNSSYPPSVNRLSPVLSPPLLIPSIPPEIQAIIEAQADNALILGIASRETFNEKAGMRLAEEYSYVYTGFWQVNENKVATSALEMLSVTKSGSVDSGPEGRVRGRVQWTFTLQWAAGQEEGIDPSIPSYPWWCRSREVEASLPAIKYSSGSLNLTCPSLPISGRSGENSWGAGEGDGGSPRGWYCSDCGKLNRQTYWRRRKCGSTHCRDKLLTGCSVKTLEHARDRGQQQPLAVPTNRHPGFIDPLIIDWDDGMKTLIYETGSEHGIRHIFTSNVRSLQEEQTALFGMIQEEVVLQRGPEDSNPSTFTLANAFSPVVETWNKVHPCITQTRDMLTHIARQYGELIGATPKLQITSLLFLSWTVDGRKKGETPLSAKSQSIVLMALGHETVIYLLPKSGLGRVEVTSQMLADVPPYTAGCSTHSLSTEVQSSANVKPEPLEHTMTLDIDNLGLLSFPPEDSGMIESEAFEVVAIGGTSSEVRPAPSNAREERPRKAGQKKGNVLKFTVIHGDALILFGDDFEYTIEREGISILLVGVIG